MTQRAEAPSATVPPAQQAEAVHPVWRCAKPCVWTVRMLTALVKGVEGGKWFRLLDKVFADCANAANVGAWPRGGTSTAGRMPTSPNRGCIVW
jgi:hypothetical protein